MKIERKDMIAVTRDHGGYKEGRCVICQKHGWIDQIKHKRGCPVNSDAKYLKVIEWKK